MAHTLLTHEGRTPLPAGGSSEAGPVCEWPQLCCSMLVASCIQAASGPASLGSSSASDTGARGPSSTAPRGQPHRLITQKHQDLSGGPRGNLLWQVEVRLCFRGGLLRPLLVCRRGREKREAGEKGDPCLILLTLSNKQLSLRKFTHYKPL